MTWQLDVVYEDTDLLIRHGVARKGDSISVCLSRPSKPPGVQFITEGFVKIVNTEAEYWTTIRKGERVIETVESFNYNQSKGSLVTAIAQETGTEWYCIMHPILKVWYDGEIINLKAGESFETESNTFIAKGSCKLDDTILKRHAIMCPKGHKAVLTALEDCTLATYWED
jgi:hypothetical protein